MRHITADWRYHGGSREGPGTFVRRRGPTLRVGYLARVLPERRPQNLDEMRALMAERGIDSRAADTCREAAALVDDPAGRSRIGGLPRLARGTAWPNGPIGPFSHVASIRLNDLPAGIRPAADGELAIFMGEDEWWPEAEPAPNFAVIHTPAASLGEPTAAPAGTETWTALPLGVRPVVNLPWDAGMPYGQILDAYFDEDDVDAIEALGQELRAVDPEAPEEGHAVLAAPAGLSDDDPDRPVLIQLNSAKTFEEHADGWCFMDVGVLLLRGEETAFRAGRFDALVPDYTTSWYSRGPFDDEGEASAWED